MKSQPQPNRFALYEKCVQAPEMMASILEAIHRGDPLSLGEDFAGTAAVSKAWIAQSRKRTAQAIDLDPKALSFHRRQPRVTKIVGDVRDAPKTPMDIIFVGNFSIGELHSKAELIAYLASVRKRLRPSGVFVCDLYDGPSAWKPSTQRRRFRTEDGSTLTYAWHQLEANRTSRMVRNQIDFSIKQGDITTRLPAAFTYHWRLWSLRSIKAAMKAAGFKTIEIYEPQLDAIDSSGRPYIQPTRAADLPKDHVILVAARQD